MIYLALTTAALVLAALPARLFVANLRLYRPPPAHPPLGLGSLLEISVLIPARDEEASIDAAIAAALASRGVMVEVLVCDDRSCDATAAIVTAWAERDPRVRMITASALPPGWCGKPHACAALAEAARTPLLAFIDADVRLAPDGLARMAAFLEASQADLVSGIPRQETVTLTEQLVIPLIHFLLLGFLPLARARRVPAPSLGTGCGQLFVVRRAAYEAVGGHATIRATLHDGLKLPRAFRAAGRRTDICDATEVASCRMYQAAPALLLGLAKNAVEALAAPALIGPATLVLFGGQVLPILLVLLAPFVRPPAPAPVLALAATAAFLAYLPRVLARRRFRQSIPGALLHPLGILLLLGIQWYALSRHALGRPATWKGRAYATRPHPDESPLTSLF